MLSGGVANPQASRAGGPGIMGIDGTLINSGSITLLSPINGAGFGGHAEINGGDLIDYGAFNIASGAEVLYNDFSTVEVGAGGIVNVVGVLGFEGNNTASTLIDSGGEIVVGGADASHLFSSDMSVASGGTLIAAGNTEIFGGLSDSAPLAPARISRS